MENNTIPYFIVYSGEFKVFRGKLTEDEILKVFDKLSDISVLGMSDIEFTNEFQQLYFDKLLVHYEKNLKAYKAKVENGKKGGRPPKNTILPINPQNTPSGSLGGEPIPPSPPSYDITCNVDIDKCFNIYRELCKDLRPLKYERRNRNTIELVAGFLAETENDFGYFEEVCKKANKLKILCNNALDFKGVIRNHIAIYNEKFAKGGENIGTKLRFNN